MDIIQVERLNDRDENHRLPVLQHRNIHHEKKIPHHLVLLHLSPFSVDMPLPSDQCGFAMLAMTNITLEAMHYSQHCRRHEQITQKYC